MKYFQNRHETLQIKQKRSNDAKFEETGISIFCATGYVLILIKKKLFRNCVGQRCS